MKLFFILTFFLTICLEIWETEGNRLQIPYKKKRLTKGLKWKKRKDSKKNEDENEDEEAYENQIYNTGPLLLVSIIAKTNTIYPYVGNASNKKKCKEIKNVVFYAYTTKLFYVAEVECKKDVIIHGENGEFSFDFEDKEFFVNTDIIVTRKTIKHPSYVKVTSYKVGEVPLHCPSVNNLNTALIDRSFDVKIDQKYIKHLELVFIGIVKKTTLEIEFPLVDVETGSIKNYQFSEFSYIIYEGSQIFTSIPIIGGNICDIKVSSTIKCSPGSPINFIYELENGNLVSNQVKVLTINLFGKHVYQDQNLNKLLERVKKALIDDND
ncbi:hypothetical protein ChUKH1_09595 [Cryptosporidium hominis]|uniref:Uncharacterized protein n=1 Tax=Cryptosporidium hominis TaxID=237895 RepID=A0ABX5BI90_CRYHO|nr:hypothetical protein [Cryptosporidium hominis TU502]OLQ19139.1 hypothetical protein ChTU502y2012_419g0005 [Cryptosporidium hominis]PPA63270.1 hypothetical protein ChUKH1_09595 [Cryptosporidium hominis]PPS97696.1 Uncharacterized protein GY17_00000001 [Cryptosporidium hominis]|eukprot:PPS97696.1 Uncharacterized protein GY17_00000001 [Cryptosporidium hominis]